MLELISAIIFSISANLDNIIIGISYGTKKFHISNERNILIALITTFVTFIAMYFGKYITLIMPASLANILGSSVLILIGLYTLFQSVLSYYITNKKKRTLNITNSPPIVSKRISYKELFLIALTLSGNNLATGIAASIINLNIFITVISTFIFGYLFMYIGNKIGNGFISNIATKYATIISGILLVLLGIIELFNI